MALEGRIVFGSGGKIRPKPVSRQHEADYLQYYGYPFYWEGPYLWGPAAYPMGSLQLSDTAADALKDRAREESLDSHLRSTQEVSGYHLETIDGEIGHVDGFVIDIEAWAIRYVEVATRNWWPGKKVAVLARLGGASELAGLSRPCPPDTGSH